MNTYYPSITTTLQRKNLSPLSWFLINSGPWSLMPTASSMLTTKSNICKSQLLHALMILICGREWSHYPLSHQQEICHCPHIFTFPSLWFVTNSKGGYVPDVVFDFNSNYTNIIDDPEVINSFLKGPLPEVAEKNPFNLRIIHTQQKLDTELTTKATKYPDRSLLTILISTSLCNLPFPIKTILHNDVFL